MSLLQELTPMTPETLQSIYNTPGEIMPGIYGRFPKGRPKKGSKKKNNGLTKMQLKVLKYMEENNFAGQSKVASDLGLSLSGAKHSLFRLTQIGKLIKTDVFGVWKLATYDGEVGRTTIKQKMIDEMKKLVTFSASDLKHISESGRVYRTIYEQVEMQNVRKVKRNVWEWIG